MLNFLLMLCMYASRSFIGYIFINIIFVLFLFTFTWFGNNFYSFAALDFMLEYGWLTFCVVRDSSKRELVDVCCICWSVLFSGGAMEVSKTQLVSMENVVKCVWTISLLSLSFSYSPTWTITLFHNNVFCAFWRVDKNSNWFGVILLHVKW